MARGNQRACARARRRHAIPPSPTRLNKSVAGSGTFVEPSKLTLGAWLTTCLTTIEPHVRPATYTRYAGIVRNTLSTDVLAAMPLQQIRPSHVQAYYTRVRGSDSTRTLHHTVLLGAFKAALVDRLVTTNPGSRSGARAKAGQEHR